MIALGFPPVVAVAIPAIGYDPLTTYALLAIPVVAFTGEMSVLSDLGILQSSAPTLQEVGMTFSLYMPLVSTGIAIAMLYLAGGGKMIKDPNSIILALLTGTTAGVIAVVSNYLGVVTLTGILSGIAVIIVLGLYAKSQGYHIINRTGLSEEERLFEKQMSLRTAFSPWILLIIFACITNLIPFVFHVLFNELTLPIHIGSFTVKTRLFWQAYTWVMVAVCISFLIIPTDKDIIKKTILKIKKRAFCPMIASTAFFAVAWIMNNSSPENPSTNMIAILSEFTSTNMGLIFPLLVPLIGFFGGFVSGSETSSIVMFTRYHVKTSNSLGLDPMTISTANGVGGGLASVITPAKVQNAAATIDQIGIEGQVIRKTLRISLMMIALLSGVTLLWAVTFPTIDLILVSILALMYLIVLTFLFSFGRYYKHKSFQTPIPDMTDL